MPDLVDTARRLITSKNTALSTMRLQPGTYQSPGALSRIRTNSRERRASVSFVTANAPTPVFHGLGFTPSGYTVLSLSKSATIYNDFPLRASSRTIVLKCDTANTVADILVR